MRSAGGQRWRGLMAGGSVLAVAAALAAEAAAAEPALATSTPLQAAQYQSATRYNPTQRTISMDVQVRDGEFTLGSVNIQITPQDVVSVDVEKLIEIVGPLIPSSIADAMRKKAGPDGRITLDGARDAGLGVEYDPLKIELALSLSARDRNPNAIQVSRRNYMRQGSATPPSDFSFYTNYFASMDYVHEAFDEQGLQTPVVDLFSAANLFGFVLENEALYDRDNRHAFSRQATRLVYDWEDQAIRFAGGDVRAPTRGFQGPEDILGLSISRLYSSIQPTRNIRPLGAANFVLERASTVEVIVNGSPSRTLRLQPGVYDLSDFPFALGGNDVQIVAQDASGRRELANFSYFLDQQLLDPGLFEFSLNYGYASELDRGERVYDEDRWVGSGFFRIGVFDFLTAGVSAQADPTGTLYGAELLVTTPLGAFAFDGARSDVDDTGVGWAGRATFERVFGMEQAGDTSLRLAAEYYTEHFTRLGPFGFPQTVELSLNGSLNYRVSESVTLGLSGSRDSYRDLSDVSWTADFSVGWWMSQDITISSGVRARTFPGQDTDYGASIRISALLGAQEFADFSADSLDRRGQASWARSAGARTDDWEANAQFTYTPDELSADGGIGYVSTRGAGRLEHRTGYDQTASHVTDSRTTLRAEGSLVYAGGEVALGPTIYDSFAIIDKHPSLGEADVFIDPSKDEYAARTDGFGPAVVPLGSYSDRTLNYAVPDAPPGYDLGANNFRVKPGYKSGYALEVGSDFSVIVMGSLVTAAGEPIGLQPGTATYMGDGPGRTVAIFTNRQGRFVAAGLKEGPWQVEVGLDGAKRSTTIIVPADSQGVVRMEPQEAR